MPTVSETTQILDFIADKPDDPRSSQAMQKLGLPPQAISAWKAAKLEPQNPKSTIVRNKIFDTIAQSLPARQEDVNDTVGFVDRFKVKNLIDRDPDLQVKYFKSKGYDSRINKGGGIEIKKPGDPQYTAVDPEGIDKFDLFDVFGDALEAVVTGVASGAKVLGAIGAPATGGTSLAVASALGGAATGGFEAGKQAIAKGIGLREEYDPNRILQSAAIGAAVPGMGKIVEKGLKAGANFIGSNAPKLVKDAIPLIDDAGKAIKGSAPLDQAAKRLGIKPALRQRFDGQTIKTLEESFEKIPTLVGRGIRKSAEIRKSSYDDVAENLVGKYSAVEPIELGEKAKGMLVSKIDDMLAPVKETYDKLGTYLKGQKEFLNLDDATSSITKNMTEFKYDDVTKSTLSKWMDKVSGIDSIDEISKIRTIVGKDAKVAYRNGEYILANSLNDLYAGLTNARTKSLQDTILNSASLKASDTAEAALQALKQADSQYKAINETVRSVFSDRVKNVKQSVQSIVDNFDDFIKDNDVVKKILDVNDPKKLQYLQKTFPDVFEVLAEGYVAQAAKSAKSGLTGQTKLTTFLNGIVKLPKKSQQIIFGDEYLQKIADLQILNKNMPPSVNPSGSAFTYGFIKGLGDELGALRRMGRLKIELNRGGIANIINNAAKKAGTPYGTAATEFTTRSILPSQAEKRDQVRQQYTFGIPTSNFTAPNR